MDAKEAYIEDIERLLREAGWMMNHLAAWLPGRIPDDHVAQVRDLAMLIAETVGGDTEHIRRVARLYRRIEPADHDAVCPPSGS